MRLLKKIELEDCNAERREGPGWDRLPYRGRGLDEGRPGLAVKRFDATDDLARCNGGMGSAGGSEKGDGVDDDDAYERCTDELSVLSLFEAAYPFPSGCWPATVTLKVFVQFGNWAGLVVRQPLQLPLWHSNSRTSASVAGLQLPAPTAVPSSVNPPDARRHVTHRLSMPNVWTCHAGLRKSIAVGRVHKVNLSWDCTRVFVPQAVDEGPGRGL